MDPTARPGHLACDPYQQAHNAHARCHGGVFSLPDRGRLWCGIRVSANLLRGVWRPGSLLLHRPISRLRIFLAKVIAGVGLYVLAAGGSFRLSGNLVGDAGKDTGAVPLANEPTLAGRHSLGAGLLLCGNARGPARGARYGSRGLALAAAFFCSYLVWNVPEFWQCRGDWDHRPVRRCGGVGQLFAPAARTHPSRPLPG